MGGGDEGGMGFGLGLSAPCPVPQVPYKPLELELAQLFLELAGEVRGPWAAGQSLLISCSPAPRPRRLILISLPLSLCSLS